MRDDGDDGEILQIRFIKIVMKMDITVTYYNEVKKRGQQWWMNVNNDYWLIVVKNGS